MVPRKRFKLPQIVILWCFVPGKRFRWNQFYVSEIKHGGGRSSDSSAQVLRNSRLEFRLLPPSQRYALRISSSGRRNIMFFRYRLVAVATLCSSDTVSWPSQRYALRISSSGRRNIMLFGYRLVAVATLCSSDTVSWSVGADAQRANCEAPERMSPSSCRHRVLSRGDIYLVPYKTKPFCAT